MLKTRLITISLLALFFMALPAATYAFEVKTGDSIYVSEGETITGNLYAAGNTVTVNGIIKGDVICAGQNIIINGKIEGDVICAGQNLTINGSINGSVRLAGSSINIDGVIGRGAQTFGASIILGDKASIGSDMLFAGAIGDIRGKIVGDLHGGGASVIIGGEVGKNIRLRLDENKNTKPGQEKKPSLTILDSAKIGGEVIYTSGLDANISDNAQISGKVSHNFPKINANKNKTMGWLWKMLYSVFSSLVIGLVLVSLWRKQIIEITDKMLEKTGPVFGWGVIVLLLSPIICLLIFLTIIGIPLAILLLIVWIIAIFISKIIVGILIGRSLLEKYWAKQKDSLIWAMVIGIIITKFIFAIPFIGWMFCLAAIFWGLGGLWLYFKHQ